jgi:hypothetical protein
MIAFLRKAYPDALPQSRLQFAADEVGSAVADGGGLGRERSGRSMPQEGREARQ